jgi:ComEC/Rec2-related protein
MTFLLSATVAYFLPVLAKTIILVLTGIGFICSLLIAIFQKLKHEHKCGIIYVVLSFLLTFLAFCSSILYFNVYGNTYKSIYNNSYTVEATVTAKEYDKDHFSKYQINVSALDGEQKSHKSILLCEYSAALEVGDSIVVTATAQRPASDGIYDEKIALLSEGIFVLYTSYDDTSLIITDTDRIDVQNAFLSLNDSISNIFIRNIKGEAGNLSSALLLGNRHLLSDVTTRDFSRAGVSHILALSGLHMSIIMGAAMFILSRIVSNRKLLAVILSLCALFYLALTGFSVSATRSVLMLLIVYLGMMVKGVTDSLTSLSIAGVIIVFISPASILDPAFWMSFCATLGILVYVPPLNDELSDRIYLLRPALRFLFKPLKYCFIALCTGLFAILPLISVMCIFIKEMSLFSIISSAILSLPTAAIIILSLLFVPLHSVPYISTTISTAIKFISDFMLEYCAEISDMENVVVSLNYPFAAAAAILIGAALLYSLISNHKYQYTSLIPCAVCIALCIGCAAVYESINNDSVKISYVNASSQSDILVISNEREAIICDISNGSKTSYSEALAQVGNARATEIRAIFLTRYSHAHNATLFDVFASEKVREIWVPYPQNEDEFYKMQNLYEVAEKYGVDAFVYNDGVGVQILDKTVIDLYRNNIDRSAVPISLISIRTVSERLVYASPAFNESDIADRAETFFAKSKYAIFGNKGPKTKTHYTIVNGDRLEAIAFADEIRLAMFDGEQYYQDVGFFTVTDVMQFYLDK